MVSRFPTCDFVVERLMCCCALISALVRPRLCVARVLVDEPAGELWGQQRLEPGRAFNTPYPYPLDHIGRIHCVSRTR